MREERGQTWQLQLILPPLSGSAAATWQQRAASFTQRCVSLNSRAARLCEKSRTAIFALPLHSLRQAETSLHKRCCVATQHTTTLRPPPVRLFTATASLLSVSAPRRITTLRFDTKKNVLYHTLCDSGVVLCGNRWFGADARDTTAQTHSQETFLPPQMKQQKPVRQDKHRRTHTGRACDDAPCFRGLLSVSPASYLGFFRRHFAPAIPSRTIRTVLTARVVDLLFGDRQRHGGTPRRVKPSLGLAPPVQMRSLLLLLPGAAAAAPGSRLLLSVRPPSEAPSEAPSEGGAAGAPRGSNVVRCTSRARARTRAVRVHADAYTRAYKQERAGARVRRRCAANKNPVS